MNIINHAEYISKSKIAIIGLGYVGLPLAMAFSEKYSVVGFDLLSSRVNDLKNGLDTTCEFSQVQLIEKSNLKFTDNLEDIKSCNIFIVAVPTPVDDVNRPDLSNIIQACETIAKYLKKNDLVIFESTVYPGLTEEICIPILQKVSGFLCNIDFGCGYSPERINPGDPEHTFKSIIKVTSGSSPAVAELVDKLYSSVVDVGTFKASSIKVAEAAKVIENAQRDINIAFINELSIIFNKLELDTAEVLAAASTKWNFLNFKPGFVGGHCIGVDPYYLTHKAEQLGYHPQVILAGRRINDDMPFHVANFLVKKMLANEINLSDARVGVLGVTFKENCPDIRNSKTIDFIQELQKYSLRVIVSDEWFINQKVGNQLIPIVPLQELNELDALVISVPHDQYKALTVDRINKMFRASNGKKILVDLKAIFDLQEFSKYFQVIRL